jgi:hypothetical protein
MELFLELARAFLVQMQRRGQYGQLRRLRALTICSLSVDHPAQQCGPRWNLKRRY